MPFWHQDKKGAPRRTRLRLRILARSSPSISQTRSYSRVATETAQARREKHRDSAVENPLLHRDGREEQGPGDRRHRAHRKVRRGGEREVRPPYLRSRGEVRSVEPRPRLHELRRPCSSSE